MLETREYNGIDILRLPFKAAPVVLTFQMLLVLVQAIVPTAAMALATAFFVNTAISVFNQEEMLNSIYFPLGILLAVVGVNSILDSLPTLLDSRLKLSMERKFMPLILDMRAELAYKHIEDANSWELIERVSKRLIGALQNGIRASGAIISSAISIVSILGLIVTQAWWIVVIIGIVSIPLFWIAFYAGKKNNEAWIESQEYERRYSYYSDEVLINRESVEERVLFGYTDSVVNRYIEKFEIARKIQLWISLKMYFIMKATSIMMVVLALIIAATLIYPVISGDLSPGMFMGVVAAVFGIVGKLGWSLQGAAEKISSSRECMRDLTEFMLLSRCSGALDLPDENPIIFERLTFRNVRFKYPTAKSYTLNNISFELESGKHYAFVGTNGAGKTTITKLLTGLYDEYEGEILINGKELRTYPTSTLKALFSMVYQDFARYEISLSENIALGDISNKVNEKQISEAVNKVALNESVSELKNGMHTPLGKIVEEGIDLSGGQWQKIALARSFISRAPMKILDEPTASLDPIAESQLYTEFEKLMKGKTTIFISHRLGSTKLADEILVIDKGRIVERGGHKDLMKENGIYAKMFESQRNWYE